VGAAAMYNFAFFPASLAMEAERLNALANHLSDLATRAKELRRYL
jgi:hypothetical protein